MNVSVHYQIRGKSGNQIAASVEDAIRAGRLKVNDRLPPIRALARRLAVSPTTVAAAYQTLRARGLVRGSGRRGTAVNHRPPLMTPSAPAAPAGVRDLANGNPDPAMLPSLREALSRIECGQLLYGGEANRADLLRVAARQFAADGIGAKSIAILSGAMDALERILAAHLRPGDIVGVEDPSYSGTLDLIAALGYAAEPIAMDEFGATPASIAGALRAGAQAIVLTPRAQNPTGAAFDRRRARELAEVLARRPEMLVIEDDFGGAVSGVPAVSAIDPRREKWAVIRSVSKALGPDLRIAIAAGDALTIARVEGMQRLGPRGVSHVLQELLVVMWSDPKVAKLVRRAADTYTERRRALIDALAAHGIKSFGRSGLNVWIPVQDESGAIQSLLESKWALRAGERFRIRAAPGIRATVAALAAEDAPPLARDIAAAIAPRALASAV
ncbi:MAG TPA: aminotransferase class I/II-fold pyridoxal phosphate-dependent enzyme [Candidatus Binataceae bacterium]|nr:aminotransferase class I/II-fold pyridoxal phosphate-dependent enzyme [Candidatus Binataceae bacterium]